jgi:hypothetical protein
MSLIVIRLLPKKPVDGDTFQDYLEGLVISVFDRSFDNPAGDDAAHALGSASYLTEGDPDATIVQHLEPPLLTTRAAVATALIEVPDPLPFSEYDTADLRFTVTRTVGANPAQTVKVADLDFNVAVQAGGMPGANDPVTYAALGPTAAYVFLPKPLIGLDPGTAHVEIPTDGTPPSFDAVRAAMVTVLAADPGAGAPSLADLTPAQCRHLAWEIVSNRVLDPLPAPPRDLETLYRGGDETARQQFEADLVTWYATHSANADVLARFAYSVAAATRCQALSDAATNVGLVFPIFPGVVPVSGGTPSTTVVVSQ